MWTDTVVTNLNEKLLKLAKKELVENIFFNNKTIFYATYFL